MNSYPPSPIVPPFVAVVNTTWTSNSDLRTIAYQGNRMCQSQDAVSMGTVHGHLMACKLLASLVTSAKTQDKLQPPADNVTYTTDEGGTGSIPV